MKKYELTDDILLEGSHALYRIRALRDFAGVNKGDLGGYIEQETNLAHEGTCWVYDEAKAYDDARVLDSAELHDYARVCDWAVVSGFALLTQHALIQDRALLTQDIHVGGHAQVGGYWHLHAGDFVSDTTRLTFE